MKRVKTSKCYREDKRSELNSISRFAESGSSASDIFVDVFVLIDSVTSSGDTRFQELARIFI
jgi:hypothetical protein